MVIPIRSHVVIVESLKAINANMPETMRSYPRRGGCESQTR